MRGLIAGLATGISLAAALLFAATGQARGDQTGSNLVQTAALSGVSQTGGHETSACDIHVADGDNGLALLAIGLAPQATEVVVAVLDTGIDASHPELAGKIVAEKNFSTSTTTGDKNGHGTHVAGIISASRNSDVGISGMTPNSKLINIKVADDYGLCDDASVARAIVWAVDYGAKVLNVSLELRNPSAVLEQAVDYAWDHGALVIAAAGNEGSSNPVYPAFYLHALAVSATAGDQLAPLSNYGDWADVAAPGFQTYSTLPGNRHGYETGTSFAAAEVSRLAALLYGTATDANGNGRLNDEVRSAIEDSALHAAALKVVHGEIDFAGALALARRGTH